MRENGATDLSVSYPAAESAHDLDGTGDGGVRSDTLALLHRLLRDVDLADLSEKDAAELACVLLGGELRIKHRCGNPTATIDFRGWLPR